MSTILKALKQSEARRPRDGGLHDSLPTAAEARKARSAWPLALVAATLSAGAVAWWFLDSGAVPETSQPAQRRVTEVQLPERDTPAPPGRQDDGTAAPAKEPGADGAPAPGKAASDAGDGAASGSGDDSGTGRGDPPPEETVPEQHMAAAAAPAEAKVDEPAARAKQSGTGSSPAAEQQLEPYALLPRLAHLSEQRRSALPDLKLNAHVYAPDPGQSFVLIDLSRYGEGDTIAPGITLAAIFPGGVVIEDDQGRFVVPRP